jgi:hypothetical protein
MKYIFDLILLENHDDHEEDEEEDHVVASSTMTMGFPHVDGNEDEDDDCWCFYRTL